MNRHLFAIVVAFLLFLLCIGGFMLWDYANVNLAHSDAQSDTQLLQTGSRSDEKRANLWVSELANLPKKEYILAANEIFIEVKDRARASSGVYQLVIDKNDIYSMFCLSQTLKNISIDFSVVKQNSTNLIYLNTQDKDVLNRVIDELKTYDIHSSIKEI